MSGVDLSPPSLLPSPCPSLEKEMHSNYTLEVFSNYTHYSYCTLQVYSYYTFLFPVFLPFTDNSTPFPHCSPCDPFPYLLLHFPDLFPLPAVFAFILPRHRHDRFSIVMNTERINSDGRKTIWLPRSRLSVHRRAGPGEEL